MQCPTCHSTIDSEAACCPFCGERIPDGPVYDEYDYEAFISYRHLPRDRAVAVKLQRRLEGMAIPKGVKQADGRKRLGKLFRDEDELPTSSSLPDQIREALKRSKYLVVVCSPETSQSAWVQREVELFSSFHGRARVRIVLAAGEPEESFPPLLRTRLAVDEDGDIITVEEEPLAADLRSDDRKRFRSESLRIAAPLIGCGYDDLVQRQHARRMRLIAIATSIVAVVSTAFGSFSVYQQHQIERNYRLTQINESEARAVQSQELLAAGDRMEAIEVALAALPKSSTSGDRPFVPAAQIALEQATYAYAPNNYWRSCYNLRGMKSLYATSDLGLQANLTKSSTVQISHIEDGLPTCTIDYMALFEGQGVPNASADSARMSFCGEDLLLTSNESNVIMLCNASSAEALWVVDLRDITGNLMGDALAISPDESLVAAGIQRVDDDKAPSVYVCLIDVATGEKAQTFELSLKDVAEDDVTSDVRAAFSPDGQCLAVSCSKTLWSISLKDGTVASAGLTQNDAYRLEYFDYAIVSVTAEDFAARLLVGSSYFDVFSPDLKLLWKKQETPSYHINSHMAGISNNAIVI